MGKEKAIYVKGLEKPSVVLRMSKSKNAIKDTITDMIEIIHEDVLNPYTRQKALEITKYIQDRDQNGRVNRYAYAQAIYDYIQQHVRYVEDPTFLEYLQHTHRLLESADPAGDCDDMTIAGGSLLTTLGIPCKIRVVGTESKDYYNHVYLLFNDQNGNWVPFDPIYREGAFKREMGEEPEQIFIKKDFPVGSIPNSFGYSQESLAVILNGDRRRKMFRESEVRKFGSYNNIDIGFYNALYNTIAGECKARLRKPNLGNDKQNKQYKQYNEAYSFFDYYTQPNLLKSTKDIPNEIINSITKKDLDKYYSGKLTAEDIAQNDALLGYLLGDMVDRHMDSLGWIDTIVKVGTGVFNFFKNIFSKKKKKPQPKPQPKPTKPKSKPTKPKSKPTTYYDTRYNTNYKAKSRTQQQQYPQQQQQYPQQQQQYPQQQQQYPQQQQQYPQQPAWYRATNNILNNPYVNKALSFIPGASGIANTFRNVLNFIPQAQTFMKAGMQSNNLYGFLGQTVINYTNAINEIKKIDQLIYKLTNKNLPRTTGEVMTSEQRGEYITEAINSMKTSSTNNKYAYQLADELNDILNKLEESYNMQLSGDTTMERRAYSINDEYIENLRTRKARIEKELN